MVCLEFLLFWFQLLSASGSGAQPSLQLSSLAQAQLPRALWSCAVCLGRSWDARRVRSSVLWHRRKLQGPDTGLGEGTGSSCVPRGILRCRSALHRTVLQPFGFPQSLFPHFLGCQRQLLDHLF